MKKILSLLMILMLASSTAMAAEKKSSKSKKKEAAKKEEKKAEKKAEKKQSSNSGSERRGFVLQVQGGLNFIASSAPATAFTGVGIGGEITAAYAFNKNFSIGLMVGLEANDYKSTTPGQSGSWSYSITEAVAQYNFDGSVHPFLFVGMGIADSQSMFDMTSPTFNFGASDTGFIFSPGIGLAFELDEKTDFFVQTRIDILTPSPDWKSLINSQGFSDGVTVPFQVGFTFSSL